MKNISLIISHLVFCCDNLFADTNNRSTFVPVKLLLLAAVLYLFVSFDPFISCRDDSMIRWSLRQQG
jgi:hypothetical protein